MRETKEKLGGRVYLTHPGDETVIFQNAKPIIKRRRRRAHQPIAWLWLGRMDGYSWL
jgi:hypothetical protein